MSEYIKREDAQRALVHTLKDAEIDNACNAQDWYCQGLMDAGVAIDDVSSADVVEVVRCKDCKHHEELLNNNDGNVLCWVHDIDVIVDGNGYCSYGEQKEQEYEHTD